MDYQRLLEALPGLGMISLVYLQFMLIARAFRPPKVNAYYWAEKMLRLSWANGFISLNEIEERFSYPPKVNGRLLYLVNTDSRGQILDLGTEAYACEELLGYYTDGHSFAGAFLWRDGLDKDPECIHIGRPLPEKPKCKNLRLIDT